MITIAEAIKSINPNAEFVYTEEDINTIEWHNGTTPISVSDIQAKQTELQAAYDAKAYARSRDTQYPSLKEFAEAYTEKEIGADTTKWDEYVVKYNKRMKEYSDDGVVLHGAYGHRWREHFGGDQIEVVIQRLQADPNDRRCVVQMWDPLVDLNRAGVDVPCNTVIYFSNNYNLEVRKQSEDRAHRIGQKGSVLYIDIVARNTLDEAIMKALTNKGQIAAKTLGEEDLRDWLL